MKKIKKIYQENGYIRLRNFISEDKKFIKASDILNYDLLKCINKTKIDTIGGYLIGNLNVYPGKHGIKILQLLKKKGLNKIIKEISGKKLEAYDILQGGNLALPFGHNQHFHTDGNFNDKMILVSVATSDVHFNSGPTEIVEKSHKKNLKYYKFLLQKKKIKKLILSFGDLVIREHCLWHRGTINRSNKNRFLITFLLFNKSRRIKKNKFQNSIRIYNNFFNNSFSGRCKEFIYIYFKFLFVSYKIILSLLKK